MAYRLRIDVFATTVLTIAACGLATAPVRTWLAPGSAQAQMPDPCQGVVGRWDWFVNNSPASPEVTIRADRTLTHGKRKGRWFCAEQRFVLVWEQGPTDMLSLSMDGSRLSGKNNAGASVNGEKIASVLPRPGDSTFDVRPPAQPSPPPSSAPPYSPSPRSKVLGMDLAPLTDDLRKRFQISATVKSGLVVLAVDIGSPASDRGIRPGDVILEVAGDSISRIGDIQAKFERLRAGGRRAAVVRVASGDTQRFVAIPVPETSATSPPSSPPGVAAKPDSGGGSPVDEFMKDFFPPRPGQQPPSTTSPPAVAAPSPAPPPSTQAGEWTTGWSRMEATVTLKAPAADTKKGARGALGIRIMQNEEIASLLLPSLKHGVFVAAINNDSAVTGVMQGGDIVTAIDGRIMRTASQLTSTVGRNSPGTQIKVEFWRRSADMRAAVSRSAQANHPTALYLLGFLQSDTKTAFAHYLRAAELGSVHAMDAVARYYSSGKPVEKNVHEAARWFRQAAERGFAPAMSNLAALIASGQLGEIDRVEIFRLRERAAQAGDVLAHYFVASYYDAGVGTARNPEAGARHLIEAIRHGGTEMLVRFSTEKTWRPSAEFYMALQRQLQQAKLYKGPIDGRNNPDLLEAFVSLQLEKRP